MMYEDEEDDGLPLMEYIEQFDNIVEIKRLQDLDVVASQLEAFTLFESADDLRMFKKELEVYIAEEFDESCLTKPIPQLGAYEIFYDSFRAHDLEDGWVHEWELPPNILPPLEGGDSGTFRYGTGENL